MRWVAISPASASARNGVARKATSCPASGTGTCSGRDPSPAEPAETNTSPSLSSTARERKTESCASKDCNWRYSASRAVAVLCAGAVDSEVVTRILTFSWVAGRAAKNAKLATRRSTHWWLCTSTADNLAVTSLWISCRSRTIAYQLMALSGTIARIRKAVSSVLPSPPRIPVVGSGDCSVEPDANMAIHLSPA
jgi:hypothetical protein